MKKLLLKKSIAMFMAFVLVFLVLPTAVEKLCEVDALTTTIPGLEYSTDGQYLNITKQSDGSFSCKIDADWTWNHYNLGVLTITNTLDYSVSYSFTSSKWSSSPSTSGTLLPGASLTFNVQSEGYSAVRPTLNFSKWEPIPYAANIIAQIDGATSAELKDYVTVVPGGDLCRMLRYRPRHHLNSFLALRLIYTKAAH